MTALKLVRREIGPRHWYSLVRLDDDRVAMGGLRSVDEAEAWAMEAGHTLVNAPDRKSTAAANLPQPGPGAAVDPSQEGVRPIPRPRPAPSGPSSRPPHGVSAPGRKSSSIAGRAREAVSVPSVRVGPASLTKDEAECCLATRDELGRLCIGYCGPDCIRRRAS